MMIALLSMLAAAETPVVPTDSGRSVTGISWARPVVLAEPEVYTMQAEHPSFSDGWLIQLSADPSLLIPRQVGDPVLYIGDVPAFRFNWDPVGGCVVAFVPGAVDLAKTEVFFGSTELPERVTRARGAEERAAARTLGVRPLAVGQTEAVLRVADFRGVEAVAMERVAACTSTDSDRMRAGMPGR